MAIGKRALSPPPSHPHPGVGLHQHSSTLFCSSHLCKGDFSASGAKIHFGVNSKWIFVVFLAGIRITVFTARLPSGIGTESTRTVWALRFTRPKTVLGRFRPNAARADGRDTRLRRRAYVCARARRRTSPGAHQPLPVTLEGAGFLVISCMLFHFLTFLHFSEYFANK